MKSYNRTRTQLDAFTRAYIECALWSSTIEPFGTCVLCGKRAPLVQHSVLDDSGELLCDDWEACGECGDSGANDYEPPADENYSAKDIAEETLVRMVADCARFQSENAEYITEETLTKRSQYSADELAGHDFWLTRNGHGAGFWDGDWEEPSATKLTDASKTFGECSLYVGDDGRIYA